MDIQTQFYSLLAQMEMNEVLETALDMEDTLGDVPRRPPPCTEDMDSAQAAMTDLPEGPYVPPPSHEVEGMTLALKMELFGGFTDPSPPPPPPAQALYSFGPQPHSFGPYGPGGPGWGPPLMMPPELGCGEQGPMGSLPQGLRETSLPLGFMAEDAVPGPPAGPAPPGAPSTNACPPQKRKPENHVLHPYIKKPPNAFMIYRQEQGPLVSAEINNTWCAAVNRVIGQRWRAMSKQQQAKYYQAAAIEKKLHNDLYPGWSSRENYGRKRRRNQRRLHTEDEAVL